ncbi:MAG: hypothetical protein SNI51_07700 [Rikenellaceae bacterium]
MNRVFSSIVLALCLTTTALAQSSSSSQPQDPNEIVVLSSYTDGNYNVERLLVLESGPNNNEFVVRYKINLTKLISSYNNNSSEIAGLQRFIESVQQDSLKKITNFDIIGYASPDGPAALNRRLANERATDFAQFVDKEYNLDEYPRTVTGKPYNWSDAKSAIRSSNTPNKAEIIQIIDSNRSQSEIEAKIKGYPSAWEYLKTNILPPMRSVEIHLKYNSWKVVENRTLIEEVVPESQPSTVIIDMGSGSKRGDKRRSESCDDVDYNLNCILIEMPGQEIDFDCDKESEKFKLNRRGAKYKERAQGEREKVKARGKSSIWY